jgi:hypothetical protein
MVRRPPLPLALVSGDIGTEIRHCHSSQGAASEGLVGIIHHNPAVTKSPLSKVSKVINREGGGLYHIAVE